jgi:hypothetical protein
MKSQNISFADFVEKKNSLGANLTWIRLLFKLDIFKNNRRIYFIFKDMLLK